MWQQLTKSRRVAAMAYGVLASLAVMVMLVVVAVVRPEVAGEVAPQMMIGLGTIAAMVTAYIGGQSVTDNTRAKGGGSGK